MLVADTHVGLGFDGWYRRNLVFGVCVPGCFALDCEVYFAGGVRCVDASGPSHASRHCLGASILDVIGGTRALETVGASRKAGMVVYGDFIGATATRLCVFRKDGASSRDSAVGLCLLQRDCLEVARRVMRSVEGVAC